MSSLRIANEFTEDLRTRNTAKILFSKARMMAGKINEVSFDFAGVHFISRAFADQFVKELFVLENEDGIKVTLENIDFPIQEILKEVRITQSDRRISQTHIQNVKFESVDAMRDFMFAW